MDYSKLANLYGKLRKLLTKWVKWGRCRLKRHFRTKKNRRRAVYIFGGVLIFVLVMGLASAHSQNHVLEHNFQDRQVKLYKLQSKLKQFQTDKAASQVQLQQKAQQLQDTQKQIDGLNQQLQAKAAQNSVIARAAAYVAPQTASAAPACGDNEQAHYIYMHESGCRLNAVNPIGACGLGQALPCSKLSSVCPNWQTDYACQNAFFTAYANATYGGWGGAYNKWLLSHWW